jgi:hypothetical protein
MALTQKKFEKLYDEQTVSAKKVYSAMRGDDASMPVHVVVSELENKGVSMAFRVVHGCLKALTEAGLVKEVEHAVYAKVPIREPELDATDIFVQMHAPEPAPKPVVVALPENKPVKSFADLKVVEPAVKGDERAALPPDPSFETMVKLDKLQSYVRTLAKEMEDMLAQIDSIKAEVTAQRDAHRQDQEKLQKFREFLLAKKKA